MRTIALDEFPDTLYVSLEQPDHEKLWNILLQRFTVKQLSQKFKINIRNIYKYKEGKSGYPVSVILPLLDEIKMKTSISKNTKKQ